jgi:hypothetical protein
MDQTKVPGSNSFFSTFNQESSLFNRTMVVSHTVSYQPDQSISLSGGTYNVDGGGGGTVTIPAQNFTIQGLPYYRAFGWKEGDMPYAEKYYQHCISLPMYPTMSKEQQQYVIKTLVDFYA